MNEGFSLSHLIERLEKATGPDRELDVEIQETVVGLEMYESIAERGGGKCIRYYPGPPGPTYRALPRYTSSIDAAMTLVPTLDDMTRPFKVTLGVSESGKKFACHFDNWKWGTIQSRPCAGYAIAIAICALKAQLSTRTNEQDDARNLSGVSSE